MLEETGEDELDGTDKGVRESSLEPKRLRLWGDEGVKILSDEGSGEKVKLNSDDGTLIVQDFRSGSALVNGGGS